MTHAFAVTFDYRCPFARHLHMGLVRGLRDGADWEVRFLPFSLDQVHVPEGEQPVWNRPADGRGSGVRALEWGLAVRDAFPDQFHDFHLAVFDIRHVQGRRFELEHLRDAAERTGLDADAVAKEVASERPIRALAAEHTEALERWDVFGVPTVIAGAEAVFVRLMQPATTEDIEHTLELLTRTTLNEFKRTRVPR